MIKNKITLQPFFFLFILLFFISFTFFVLGAITDILRPISDGSNDSAGWINTDSGTCDTSSCVLHVDEYDGTTCTDSDGDFSYIESSTDGATQTFDLNLTGIPTDATINQISVTVCHRKIEGPSNDFVTTICIDGECSNSPNSISNIDTYRETTQTFSDLDTVKGASTDVEIGVSIVGNNGWLTRITQLSSIIDYTPDGNGNGNGNGEGISAGGVSPSLVSFEGLAYPGSSIEVLRKSYNEDLYRNVPIESHLIRDDGSFLITYKALLSREYFFTVRAVDKDERKTGILSFGVNLSETNLIVKDIFFPPTIGFIKTIVQKGDEVEIVGYASPDNAVELRIDGNILGTILAENDGSYAFSTSTEDFDVGNYFVRGQQIDSTGRKSGLSISNVFKVADLEYPKADFSNDGVIDISDWSIFLFRWGSLNIDLKSKIDLDNNGVVDIYDLSIFLKAIKL